MKKRIFVLMIVAAMLLSMLSSCGKPAAVVASGEESDVALGAESIPEETPAPEVPSVQDTSALETSAEELPSASEPEFVTVDLPLTQEPVTMSYWTELKPFLMAYNVDLPDVTFFREMEARTGIHLDITAVMIFSAAENFNLMVASGDYADMMDSFQVYYTGNADSAIEQGIIVDLMDYIDDMPNYRAALNSKESFWRDSLTQNGALPSANMLMATGEGATIGMMIREDWLKDVEMDVPVTYDEMEQLLAALKDRFGIGAMALGAYGQNYGLSAGFGVREFEGSDVSKAAFMNIDGEVLYAPATEGYRDYLTLLNDWYAKGYIWQDFISQANNAYSYLVSSDIGVLTAERDYLQFVTDALHVDDPDAGLIGMRALRHDPDEVLNLRYYVENIIYGTAISASSEYVDLITQWLDYCYSPDGQLLTNYGVEGEGLAYNEDGEPCCSDLILHSDTFSAVAATVVYAAYGGAMLCYGDRVFEGYDQRVQDAITLWGKDTQDWVYPTKATLTTEQGELYANIINDMNSYIEEQTLKFIVGDIPLDDANWDAYMDTLESMGLQDVIEIKTDALEAYMNLSVA